MTRDPFAPPEQDAAPIEVESVPRPAGTMASDLPPPAPAKKPGLTPGKLAAEGGKAMVAGARPGLELLISIPASLLPLAWRQRIGAEGPALRLGGILSGMIQTAGAVIVGGYLYEAYREAAMTLVLQDLTRAAHDGAIPEESLLAIGSAFFFGWLIATPAGLACMYFFGEGLLRAGAAGVGEVLGSLPLFLVEKLRAAVAGWNDARRLGPPVVDEVRLDGGTLVIATCRDRGWDKLTTIEHDGKLYLMESYHEQDVRPRSHVYRLLEAPYGHVVRGKTTRYAPDDLLPVKGSRS